MWETSLLFGAREIPAFMFCLRIPWIGPGEKQGDGKWLGEGVLGSVKAWGSVLAIRDHLGTSD